MRSSAGGSAASGASCRFGRVVATFVVAGGSQCMHVTSNDGREPRAATSLLGLGVWGPGFVRDCPGGMGGSVSQAGAKTEAGRRPAFCYGKPANRVGQMEVRSSCLEAAKAQNSKTAGEQKQQEKDLMTQLGVGLMLQLHQWCSTTGPGSPETCASTNETPSNPKPLDPSTFPM